MEPSQIIDYWYSEPMRSHWFSSTPEIDARIRERYQQLWTDAAQGRFDHWRDDAPGCLALVLVFDQFPLNMFRGEARSFQTEGLARQVAAEALDRKFDALLKKEQLAFLFMPFMHSENLDDQDLSVALYERHGLENNLRFARHHREIIRRFGRFPHRNRILGRQSTREEQEYLASKEAFLG